MLTTSWPSRRLPYAGHFVQAMGKALVREGAAVAVATVEFEGDDGLLATEAIELVSQSVPGQAGGLASAMSRWLPSLRALAASARSIGHCDVWIAHWWPTVLALPRGERALVVLHGSDVDLLERLPPIVATQTARRLARRATVVGVAPHLGRRFDALVTGVGPETRICPLGAEPPANLSPPSSKALNDLDEWLAADARVLTVARDVPGKGLDTARLAAERVNAAWLIADGRPALDPAEVWALVSASDLIVVPSEQGKALPSEGMPYIIAQALACGTPVLGGPNGAVVEALAAVGQPVVTRPGSDALAHSVNECLRPSSLSKTTRRAQAEGRSLQWRQVLAEWHEAVSAATR